MTHHIPLRYTVAGGACLALLLGLAACDTPRSMTSNAQPVVTTVDGVQQFPVPAEGRALMAQRLATLVSGRITDARISNAWRTAAAAQSHPDDYAACVSADAGRGTQVFLIVKSGPGTGDVIRGDDAVQRCSDQGRVAQWMTFPEAIR